MKIVTIWSTYGPYHLARVKALKEVFSNFDVIPLAHCSRSDEYSFFNNCSADIRVLVDKSSNNLNFIESFLATIKTLIGISPNLILTCGYERPETLASLIWAKLNNAAIFLMLDNNLNDKKRNKYVEFVKSVYLNFFDGFIYGGDTERNYLHELHIPYNRIVTGYNCVDNNAIMQSILDIKERNSPIVKKKYFLCVSRLIPKKNVARLVQAYAYYVKNNTNPWSLVICGDGPEKMIIEKIIVDEGLSGLVMMKGLIINQATLHNYYAFAQVFVLPSHENEQWGLVVNEAMASGLPVLVSKYCGCASSLVLEGENGFLIDGKSSGSIAMGFSWMHNHPEMLNSMGLRSAELIETFSPKNFALNIRALYLNS